MSNRRVFSFFVLLFTTVLVVALYGRFLSNGLVFDDHGLFTSMVVYEAAQLPFNLQPRTFPYFTLGFIQVVSGTIEANRIFSLCLHLANAFALFFLLKALLLQAIKNSKHDASSGSLYPAQTPLLAAVGACIFAIHPIAVYGVAYLAQRTILFATLFSLLSLWFYRRAFAENRTADLITAAILYSLAVFSKEHAIMLPLVALPLTLLYRESWQADWKRISLYLALCFPAGLSVLLMSKHIVATSYEPDVAVMLAHMHEISILDKPFGKWLLSIFMQAGFFFDYLLYWLVPDVRVLSVDMRIDFLDIWFSWVAYLKAFLFFLSPFLAIYFLRRKGLVSLFCCGFLYCWFLFLTELAAVRFQEPFVLYRSYLWAPGYLIMLVAVFARISSRRLMICAIPVLMVCFLLAHERLFSFVDEGALWKDAAQKLSSPKVMGSERIFYNRGNAYLAENRYAEAIADYSLAIQRNPMFPHAYYNRGLAYSSLSQRKEALADIDRALFLNNKFAAAMYTRGFILDEEGCFDAARDAYVASMSLGNEVAKLKVRDLDEKIAVLKKNQQVFDLNTCPD